MKGLLIKDFFLNFRNSRTIIMFLMISVFMGFSMEGEFIISYTTMLMGILALGTISYDDLDNGMSFLLTLPVDRKTYVTEKFLYSLLMEVMGLIFGIIIHTGISLIRGTPVNLISGVPYMLGTLLVLHIMISSMITLQLKFGAEKVRFVLMLVYGFIFVAALALTKLTAGQKMATAIVSYLTSMSPVLLGAIIFAIGIAIELAIYLAALKVLDNKEY